MAAKDILPTSNLRFDDIRDTLNANGGSVSNAVETAFKAAAKINMWSKHKPVKRNYPFCQDFDSGKPSYIADWWKASDGNCGITYPSYTSYGQVLEGYDGMLNGWAYDLPTGGTRYPFRLGDFAGYYPGATNPAGDLSVSPREIHSGEELALTFYAEFISRNPDAVSLQDIGDLQECYMGAVFFLGDEGQGYVTVSKKIKDIDVTAETIKFKFTGDNGKYRIMPVICRNPQTSYGGTTSNTFIPYPGASKELLVSPAVGVNVFCSAQVSEAQKQVTYDVTLQAGSAGNHVFTDVIVQITSSNGGQFYTKNLGGYTVEKDKKKTLYGTLAESDLSYSFSTVLSEAKAGRLYINAQADSGQYTDKNQVNVRP